MDNRKLEVLMSAMADVLEEKNATIFVLKAQLDDLKEKLAAAQNGGNAKETEE